ncbi:MAG: aminotransferase class IV [Pseudomonadota bacterium]
MERIVFYNGAFLKESGAAISPFSRGLNYGDGVFETLRSYAGGFFRFEDHISRLSQGLKTLRINLALDNTALRNTIKELLQVNRLSDAAIKILAFREGGEGPDPAPQAGASVVVTARPFDHDKKSRYEHGIKAHVAAGGRNTLSPLVSIKSMNYLENILGRLEAHDHHADEALFLNIHGMVAEGATSNIFMARQGTLYTPPADAGILMGITRSMILRIVQETGCSFAEQNFSLKELLEADEAFLTNSLMEIMPLTSINNKPVSNGLPGDITKKLLHEYHALVTRELT